MLFGVAGSSFSSHQTSTLSDASVSSITVEGPDLCLEEGQGAETNAAMSAFSMSLWARVATTVERCFETISGDGARASELDEDEDDEVRWNEECLWGVEGMSG